MYNDIPFLTASSRGITLSSSLTSTLLALSHNNSNIVVCPWYRVIYIKVRGRDRVRDRVRDRARDRVRDRARDRVRDRVGDRI